MKNKILSLLGFAMKAGKIQTGNDTIIAGLDKGKIKLVIVSDDVKFDNIKKIYLRCKRYNIPIYELYSRDELSSAIGRDNRVAIGVADNGFSIKLIEYFKECNLTEMNSE